jgi:hypothetical protein
MTPEARPVAVRLLLDHGERFGEGEQVWSASMRALDDALAEFNQAHPQAHRVLLGYFAANARSDKPPAALSDVAARKLEQCVDWLAARMPAQIVVPQAEGWAAVDKQAAKWERLDEILDAEDYIHFVVESLTINGRAPSKATALRALEPHPQRELVVDGIGRNVVDELIDVFGRAEREALLAGRYDVEDEDPEDDDEISYVPEVLADLFNTKEKRKGFDIVQMSSGLSPGRPVAGTRKPDRATELLLERCPGRTVEELRACVAVGRVRNVDSAVRDELVAAVKGIRDARLAPTATLAQALKCTDRTVRNLAAAKRSANVPNR